MRDARDTETGYIGRPEHEPLAVCYDVTGQPSLTCSCGDEVSAATWLELGRNYDAHLVMVTDEHGNTRGTIVPPEWCAVCECRGSAPCSACGRNMGEGEA